MTTSIAANPGIAALTAHPSLAARRRMLSRRGEPMFLAAWRRVLMLHFEVDPDRLQCDVPFPLDLRDGRAFVSLVAFTMEAMRPRLGGPLTARLFRPIATHDFLNFRTYVVRDGEPGIHFLAEWLNSRLAVLLGPTTFGLPYRYGHLRYDFNESTGSLNGRVTSPEDGAALAFHGNIIAPLIFRPAETGSLTEWLMERYTAYNSAGGRPRFFRVWHPPWPQVEATVRIEDRSLLTANWPWLGEARLISANYSPGFAEVWMGRPHGIRD
jgi:uncharacterized protein YqjF (DUF2071 family)